MPYSARAIEVSRAIPGRAALFARAVVQLVIAAGVDIEHRGLHVLDGDFLVAELVQPLQVQGCIVNGIMYLDGMLKL